MDLSCGRHSMPPANILSRLMESKIINIMESWPLQLTLQSSGAMEQVTLAEGVRISRSGSTMDTGDLHPEQTIRIVTQAANGQVTELEILA
jgi:hypothetical protein